MASVSRFRQYASECVRLAGKINAAGSKAVLLDMAQSWLRLAARAEENGRVDPISETPTHPAGPAPDGGTGD